jgi:hypothetical protein
MNLYTYATHATMLQFNLCNYCGTPLQHYVIKLQLLWHYFLTTMQLSRQWSADVESCADKPLMDKWQF